MPQELIDWLNASLHQKQSCIDSLSAALSTIGNTVRACGLDPVCSPTPASDRHPLSVLSASCTAPASGASGAMYGSGGADSRRGSPEQGSPAGSGVHGLADQSVLTLPHFSIADDTDEDY
jgi:hypothetical protein